MANTIVYDIAEAYIKDHSDEIIELLKKHLSVCIYDSSDYYGTRIGIELYFDNKEICHSSTYIGKQNSDD